MIDLTYKYDDSVLHKTDPAIKFIGLILLSILLLMLNGYICLITSVLIISVLLYLSHLNVTTVINPLKRFLWFFVMIFLMNALFYKGSDCIFSIWLICFSKEGISHGIEIILRTAAVMILSIIFIRTTTTVEIMKGIEKVMAPLRFFGVRDIALIMSIALQFIPVLYADFDRIRKAQIARGADFTGKSFINRIKLILPLVIPAFVSAFRRADELSIAMEARGFGINMDSDTEKK